MPGCRWCEVRIAAIAGVVAMALSCTDRDAVDPIHVAPSSPAPQVLQGHQGRAGKLVVTLANAEQNDFEASVRALGGRVTRRYPEIAVVTVSGVSAGDVPALAARSDVASVDNDLRVQWIPPPDQMAQLFTTLDTAAIAPSGGGVDQSGAELFRFQWNLRVIEAPAAWHATPAGSGRLVCVLDTGVDPDHVELAGRIALDRSTSFVDSEPTIQDFNAHGTFVSSIISSNGIRIASVASGSRLCAVKVLATDGTGTFSDLIAGILYAVHVGADVINMSLGAYVDVTDPEVRSLIRALQRAIDIATRHGVVVVAAAGNDGIDLDADSPTMLVIPAQLEHVISVGATAPFNEQGFDALATYSNFGFRAGIDLVAPGGDLPAGGSILDLVLGACSHTEVTLAFRCQTNYVLSGFGTSFAAPHVAGAAAVVGSGLGRRAPRFRIVQCLLEGADAVGPPRIFGAGRLNVAKAAACQTERGSRPRHPRTH